MKKLILTATLKWLLSIAITFFILLSAFSAGAFFYKKKYERQIYPGVKIGSLDLSGASKEEAEIKIRQIADALSNNGIAFYFNDIRVNISPILSSATDSALTKEILRYDEKDMLNAAYDFGRTEKTIGENFSTQLNSLIYGKNILPAYDLNREELVSALKDNFSEFEKPAQNAKIEISEKYEITIESEKSGYSFNYAAAITEFSNSVDKFDKEKIIIPLEKIEDEPVIKKRDSFEAVERAKKLLDEAPFALIYDNHKWTIEKGGLKDWIALDSAQSRRQLSSKESAGASRRTGELSPATESPELAGITLDKEKVIAYLKDIAPKIDIAPQNAKFEIKDGKVAEFQTSHDGLELDLEKNYEYIRSNMLDYNEKEINLIVKVAKANVTTANINNLGIREIIGIGKSNFKGSPNNRRRNIKTGAASLNGLLIAPEENFSLVSALGEIDGEHGYLPELVIKGNKTIPEYGGGLCQIGTTLFRAALDTGLPITERRNHSYRVSYYEPAGTDATIYNPRPDMRFINDTGHHILIQTRIEGDDLIFEFWGTKDGRVVEKDDTPRIFNIVKPGPAKIVETEDLAPGEKKCAETSHNGADAEFSYTVTYPNGEVKEELFKSHYKPWQAVCLVGIEKTEIATSTEEITE